MTMTRYATGTIKTRYAHAAPDGSVKGHTSTGVKTHVTLRTYVDNGVSVDGVVAFHKSEAHAREYVRTAPSNWSNVRIEPINNGVRA
jgi:hypothetical protein